MDRQNQEIPELIFKSANKSISIPEQIKLDAWLNQTEANKTLYHEVLNDINLKGALKKYFAYNATEAWHKIEQNINKRPTKKSTFVIGRWVKVAAAMTVPLILGAYMLMQLLGPRPLPLAQSNLNLIPGIQSATLTLSNGKSVILGEHKSIKEIVLSNLSTAIDTNYTLSYNHSILAANHDTYNTLETPRGGEYALELADGTKVWLNAASKIRYPTQFSDTLRQVYVEGEAYFEVKHNAAKPFVVNTQNQLVTVLGTSFNVQAYTDEYVQTTTLVEGKVKVNAQGQSQDYFLKPSQQTLMHLDNKALEIIEVDTELYTAWRNGLFVFKGEDLESIMRKFSRWYACDIRFSDEKAKDLQFTGSLKRTHNLKNILEIISASCQVEFNVTENQTITINKM